MDLQVSFDRIEGAQLADLRCGRAINGPECPFRSVEVLLESHAGSLTAGQAIAPYQNGGVKDGVTYTVEEVELFQVGERYLLFIRRKGTMEWYSAAPYGQYRLDGQTLIGPEYWANAGVVKELAGRSVDEVRAMVKAAAAD